MYRLERGKIVNKTQEQVWENYEDPANNWIKWDKSLKAVSYEGQKLEEGKKAILTLQNDKKINMEVIKVDRHNEFTDISENKVFKIKFYHVLEKLEDNNTKITHAVEVTSKIRFLKFLESKVCNEIIKDVEESLVEL